MPNVVVQAKVGSGETREFERSFNNAHSSPASGDCLVTDSSTQALFSGGTPGHTSSDKWGQRHVTAGSAWAPRFLTSDLRLRADIWPSRLAHRRVLHHQLRPSVDRHCQVVRHLDQAVQASWPVSSNQLSRKQSSRAYSAAS